MVTVADETPTEPPKPTAIVKEVAVAIPSKSLRDVTLILPFEVTVEVRIYASMVGVMVTTATEPDVATAINPALTLFTSTSEVNFAVWTASTFKSPCNVNVLV